MTINAGAPVTVSFSNLGAPTLPIDTLANPTGNYVTERAP